MFIKDYKTIEYAKRFYGVLEAYCVAAELQKYDQNKVKYAIESGLDIFDLDRWEYAGKLHKELKLQSLLSNIGFDFTNEELDYFLQDGDRFFKNIVDPLWRKDYEIIELESYQLVGAI